MNTANSMGPIQLALFTYIICVIVSLGVAGLIKMLVGYINLQNKKNGLKAGAKAGSAES